MQEQELDSVREVSGEKCENCEMMESRGSSDLRPDVCDQSHLAETRDRQNLPRSRTLRIGGGPLLQDSDKIVIEPPPGGCQSHPAGTPDQQNLP